MKAVVYERYGLSSELHLVEIEKPVPKENEVLIQVVAASINSWDWDLLRGKPYLSRLGGLFKPKYRILGADISGRVVSVGKNVSRWKLGDEVFGDLSLYGWGGFAEYVTIPEEGLALKPSALSFEDAASSPQASSLAIQGLFEKGRIQPGDQVLINGAGGGVGTFAIQIAKAYGAEITGVDRASKWALMKEIGADYVLDYRKTDYTKSGKQYDLILDMVAEHSIFDYKKVLKRNGRFVMIGGATKSLAQVFLIGGLISFLGKKELKILLWEPKVSDYQQIMELMKGGKVKPIIYQSYPLEQVPQAFQVFGNGDIAGKIIITME